jgi:hypothetical protein
VRTVAVVLACVVCFAAIVVGLLVVGGASDADRERKIQRCLDAGGDPDVWGRYGDHVECYQPGGIR